MVLLVCVQAEVSLAAQPKHRGVAGCVHQYCYCREKKYAPHDDPADFAYLIQVKENAPDLLRRALSRAPVDVIGTGDYQPAEKKFGLSRQMLEVCLELGFPVSMLDRSPLVLRDLDLLQEINQRARAVMMWSIIYTPDSAHRATLRQLERLAPPPDKRFAAMAQFARAGILTGTCLMPVLPDLCDTDENLEAVVRWTAEHGGAFVLAGTLTMADQQRDYFLGVLEGCFPDLADRYRRLYPPGSYGPSRRDWRPVALPLIAVPTTAGTGSEMTQVTVIEDEEMHSKWGVRSPYLFARATVLDPALTLSLPAHLTAATGADVVGHALEAFVGRRANPISDVLALEALRRAWRHLPRATHQGDDLATRQEMMLASAMAGLAFDQSGLGIIHSLAGPVTGRYGLHHGQCVGLLLPHGLAYNLPVLGDKRPALLQALDLPASTGDEELVAWVKGWLRDLGLPATMGQLGIRDPDLLVMAEEASRMVLLPNNPRSATVDDCQRLLERIV